MSRVQILSSLPITARLSSNEGFFEINSHWTYRGESFILLILSFFWYYCMHTRCIGANLFLYSLIFYFYEKKALLVQFGRTWVSKTRCRRFKSYRAWFGSSSIEFDWNTNWNSNLNLTSCILKKGGGQSKKEMLINQRSNWSPRLYCKYAVTNNPAKVIGIRPNTIPNRKTSIISICLKGEKRGNIYT